MDRTQQKKRLLTEKMADHLLESGFAGFTLRSLGSAAGTSDRMLLHYFADKNEIMIATLTLVSDRLLGMLRSLQPGKMNQRELIGFLAGLINTPETLPYTNLWLELTAVAIREGEPYRSAASGISVAFLDWIKASLDTDGASADDEAAAFILTFTEGLVLINAIGKSDEAGRAVGWITGKGK